MYTVVVDIRHDLHVPGWRLQRHDYEGNSWKTTEAQARDWSVPLGQMVCLKVSSGLASRLRKMLH